MASSVRRWSVQKCRLCCISLKRKLSTNTRNLKKAVNDKNREGKESNNPKKYSYSVFLPSTSFLQRINSNKISERDTSIYEKCSFAELYRWQRSNIKGPEFILHDGPPYANGKMHMGHAINKILKDVTNRNKILRGNLVHYVPGWDCHGLPIELKAVSGRESLSPIEIRSKAREFAKRAVDIQRKAFQTWGVMADWQNGCYFTDQPDYTKKQLKLFYNMYEKGFIYRDLKPVYWSPSSRTALAEAELEYDESHVSTSATVKMKITCVPDTLLNVISKSKTDTLPALYALVWTTTPWTLPSNRAICYSPKLEYVVAKLDGSSDECIYLLGKDACSELEAKIGRRLEIIASFFGQLLEGVKYEKLFSKFGDKVVSLPFLPGSHVAAEKGTGLVHTAPAHGPDDFVVALSHGLPLDCYVDEEGCFSSELAHLGLEKLSVLSEEATQKVMSLLDGNVVHSAPFTHSYPYDWRTKQPVILRASQQWFVDTHRLKEAALESLSKVEIVPGRGEQRSSRMATMLQRRPYWCISRQRAWGVPLPVLYDRKTGRPLISRDLVEHLCSCIDKHGPDFWWTLPTEDIASKDILSKYSADDLEKGKDIMDIWFDSGVSWSTVLEKNGNKQVADLYLEGVDQFTGWFQSSLMTSCAIQGTAPYRKVYVHGFAVDKDGRKMSKSLGNVVDPQEIISGGNDVKKKPAFGVDTLRWWVASHSGHHNNVPVSSELMQASAESVHKLRLVLRFLLGSLKGFGEIELNHNRRSYAPLLDRYLLHLLHNFDRQILEYYGNFQYNWVCSTLTNFITNEVSAVYCHLIKDRLYCGPKNSDGRVSCLRTLSEILDVVSRAAAPILPHLIEEVYLHHPNPKGGAGFFRWAASGNVSSTERWCDSDVAKTIELALSIRHELNQKASSLGEGNTWKLGAKLYATGDAMQRLKLLQVEEESSESELAEILQVSKVYLCQNEGEKIGNEKNTQIMSECDQSNNSAKNDSINPAVNIDVYFVGESAFKCDRCRRYTSTAPEEACQRCTLVLNSM